MPLEPLVAPILYSANLESPEADEAETIAELVETMRGIAETTFRDSGDAKRGAHAKSHGVLRCELQVLEGLPPELRQGLFANPGRHPATLRLSTAPADPLPDSVSTPRGAALKIDAVEGERLPGSEDARSQDFVMVNGPAFLTPNAKTFLANMKLIAATTDKAPALKVAASAVLRGTEKVIEAFGGHSDKIIGMGGHPLTHILGETFFTQVPLRYGDYVAKVRLAPVSENLKALKDRVLELDEPNALRLAVVDFFHTQDAEWALQVQLCRDPERMPIEEANVVWPEEISPYQTVAFLRAPAQQAWSADMPEHEGRLSFSPWHGLAAHQPLGSVMRARKPAYEMSARFRAERGAAPGGLIR